MIGAPREPHDRHEARGSSDTRHESIEVDLSSVLDGLADAAPVLEVETATEPAESWEGLPELQDEQNGRVVQDDEARAEYKRALALIDLGEIDASIPILQGASLATGLRFPAALCLARIFMNRESMHEAVEWFERAADARPPSAAEGYQVLYDLTGALESIGEAERALAVCMELQAEAGSYRDIPERIERLSRVARGIPS